MKRPTYSPDQLASPKTQCPKCKSVGRVLRIPRKLGTKVDYYCRKCTHRWEGIK